MFEIKMNKQKFMSCNVKVVKSDMKIHFERTFEKQNDINY